jgi:RNA polymerase sigma factor (sigma-70 family)
MLHAVNNDSTIWQSFKAGDRTSFEKIYQLYFKNLYEYGMRLLNNSDLVKDYIHDLFVKIWLNKSNLGEVTNVKSYLLVSLRGTIYNNTKNKKATASIEEFGEEYYFKMDFSAENEFIRKDEFSTQRQKLLTSMNSLSARQKEVIYLRYFEELSYDEIASIMHISVKATYKLSARALDSLRQILNVSNASLFILIALSRLQSLN